MSHFVAFYLGLHGLPKYHFLGIQYTKGKQPCYKMCIQSTKSPMNEVPKFSLCFNMFLVPVNAVHVFLNAT